MKMKLVWSLLILGLAAGTYRAQEKQAAKGDQSAAPAANAGQTTTHNYNMTQEDKDRKNPIRFTDFSVERGKKIYGFQCAMCHGEKLDGKGDLAEEMKIQPTDFTKPEVLAKRTDGGSSPSSAPAQTPCRAKRSACRTGSAGRSSTTFGPARAKRLQKQPRTSGSKRRRRSSKTSNEFRRS